MGFNVKERRTQHFMRNRQFTIRTQEFTKLFYIKKKQFVYKTINKDITQRGFSSNNLKNLSQNKF